MEDVFFLCVWAILDEWLLLNCLWFFASHLWSSAVDLGVDVNLCHKEVTTESSGEYLIPRRHGPGSCLQTLIDLLSETHNSLVREVRRTSHTEDRSVLQTPWGLGSVRGSSSAPSKWSQNHRTVDLPAIFAPSFMFSVWLSWKYFSKKIYTL